MTFGNFVRRGKKALRMPPAMLLGRLRDEVRQQTKRPWANWYPRTLRDGVVLNGADIDAWWAGKLQDGPFFLRPADRERWTADYQRRYPAEVSKVIAQADGFVRHEFDLLGSGPANLGATLPWHKDFKTGREWPLQFCRDIEYLELERPSDVKVPWELSRAQHLPVLGQAYWLTGDERYAREFVAVVDDWITRNPLGYGVNWACAMDVALRAANWIWGLYFMGDSAACRDRSFRRRVARSLYIHGEFVSRNLETSDINGNHYLSDGVGLIFLGILFRDTADGRRWLDTGRAILNKEILLQVHEDGVDHEASTPYHRLVLELFLTAYLALERAGVDVPQECWSRLERMLEFVAAYTKADGSVPLVGDADDGRVQKLGQQELNDHRYLLSACAARFGRGDFKQAATRFWDESFWLLGPDGAAAYDALEAPAAPRASAAFPDGGFFVLQNDAAHVFIDCGEIGMRGRGGHGHNDILSFELFMRGSGVVTDCGAYVYTASREWRNKFRSTAFHNTIQIDDEEVNRFVEPNALWQMQYDAIPDNVKWMFDASGSRWEGGHSGYRRLPQPCSPRRGMWLDPQRALVALRDEITGTGRHRVTWRFHLDPACRATLDDGDCRLNTPTAELWLMPVGQPPAALRITDGWVSKSYGVKTPTQVVMVDAELALPVSFSYLFADARLAGPARAHAAAALQATAALQ
jgi:uncharacterized heparinase superfamily protein